MYIGNTRQQPATRVHPRQRQKHARAVVRRVQGRSPVLRAGGTSMRHDAGGASGQQDVCKCVHWQAVVRGIHVGNSVGDRERGSAKQPAHVGRLARAPHSNEERVEERRVRPRGCAANR
jgi:hypothetical protein